MDILYRDFGASRYRDINERMANPGNLSPHGQIFQPLSNLSDGVAQTRYQSTPENALSLNWYVKMNIDTARDRKSWADLKVPAGETLDLYKHLPGWNRVVDAGWLVGCNSDGVGAVDISIVTVDDPTTDVIPLGAGVDLTVPSAGGVDPASITHPDSLIQRDNSYLLKVSITPPFTDADGNGVFTKNAGTTCEEGSCIRLMVHVHLRNMCFKEELRGCNIEDYDCPSCCDEEYDDPCAPEAMSDDFSAAPVSGAAGGVAGNVLANDTVDGVALLPADAILSVEDDGGLVGVAIDPATGDLIVPAGAAPGTYEVEYKVCEVANPTQCSVATATVVVGP